MAGVSGGGYVTSVAPTRVELSQCVECGLCLPHCPTFRLTGREIASPRGRLAAMRAVLDGAASVDRTFDEALSFCLGCRACEAVCPSLVPYGRVLEGARAELVAQRPTIGRRLRRWLLGRVVPNRKAMRAGTLLLAVTQPWIGRARPLGSASGLRPLSWRPSAWVGGSFEPRAPLRGTVGLLAGCVMEPWFGSVHQATVETLRLAGYRVVVPENQTCCGALAAHDGHADLAARLAERNTAAFADVDLVVANAAGCSAHLKGYGHWAENGGELSKRVRDATELVAELIRSGVLPSLPEGQERVAVQDPCHLRHAQRIVDAPRIILRAAGYRPVEIDPDGLCCGAAGIYSLLRPDASRRLGERKAAQVKASAARLVASANPGCEMQLRSHLDGGYRIVHPVELYWEAVRTGTRRDPRGGAE